MKKIGVAILGLGDVGSGTYRILNERREFYQKTQNVDIEVVSVLDADRTRATNLNVPEEKIASNIAEVAGNPDVNMVVECIDDTATAKEYALTALKIGQTVVTSNKELYAKYSHELERVATRHYAGLYFEASCYGGIPVVKTLMGSLQGEKIYSVMSTVNGSIEDAAYQLSVLASLAFHTKVPYSKVVIEDDALLPQADAEIAKQLGYQVKRLAVGIHTDAGLEVRVQPTLVKATHPIAALSEGLDAVLVEGDSSGTVLLAGNSTGALPAAGAIISDILYIATHSEYKYSPYNNTEEAEKPFAEDAFSAYYLRFTTEEPGTFAKIISTLRKNHVSTLEALHCKQEGGKTSVVLITYPTRELALRSAIEKIQSTLPTTAECVFKAVH